MTFQLTLFCSHASGRLCRVQVLDKGPECRARLAQEGVPRAPEMQGQQALTCRTLLQERRSRLLGPQGHGPGSGVTRPR